MSKNEKFDSCIWRSKSTQLLVYLHKSLLARSLTAIPRYTRPQAPIKPFPKFGFDLVAPINSTVVSIKNGCEKVNAVKHIRGTIAERKDGR